MGLNNIQLPAHTIVDLYRNSLCEDDSLIGSVKKAAVTEPARTIQAELAEPIKAVEQIGFLGKNLMQLLILVNYSEEVYLPENQLNFITNILKACKMNLADVAIVNINKQPVTIGELTTQLNPRNLVIFGIDPLSINLSKQLSSFNVTTHHGMQVFTAPSLEHLNQDNEDGKLLKSKLWLCMKTILNL